MSEGVTDNQNETGLQESPESDNQKKIELRSEFGLPTGLSIVIGTVIGSGIFISPQGVLLNTGSVGLCLIVWLGGAVLSIFGSLTYIELVSVVRKSGINYAALMKAMGPIPAFLSVWAGEITIAAGRAVGALSFAEYVLANFDICGSPEVVRKLLGSILIITLTVSSSYSVRLSARVQIVFTVTKLLALAIIIGGGIYSIATGTLSDLPTGFQGSTTSPSKIALSFYSVMYAYGGWNNVNMVVEEMKRPRRNASLASALGVLIVAFVYILTNVSYLAVLSKEEMLQSPAVGVLWANKILGPAAWIIPVSVVLSVFGALNGGILTSTRTMYVAARDGLWFEILSFVSVKRYTPMPAILFQCFFCIIFIISGNINALINFLSFAGWLMQTLCSLCVIILRFKVKDDPKRIKIPIVFPILFSMWSAYLVLAPIVEDPQVEVLYGAAVVAAGLVLYVPVFHFKLKPNFLNTVEMYLQLLFEISPGGYDSKFYK